MASKSALVSLLVLLGLSVSIFLISWGFLNTDHSRFAVGFRKMRRSGMGALTSVTDLKPPTRSPERTEVFDLNDENQHIRSNSKNHLFVEVSQTSAEVDGSIAIGSFPQVLLLTPLKQAAGHLERYFKLIDSLSYPKNKLSLGYLVSDSSDGTYDLVKEHFTKIQGLEEDKAYRKVTLIKQDFNYLPGNSWTEIHALGNQLQRRQVLAKSRNYLLMSAIRPEHEWILWIDSDLSSYPNTLVQDLIGFTGPRKHIIAPNNFWKTSDGKELPYDRNNWQETPESLRFLKDTKETVLFEGYSAYMTGRLILGDLRGSKDKIVKLDGVGGTVLLVRARLHREGLVFLPVPFKKAIETEALGKLAVAMGYQPWGLPNYVTFH